MSKTDLRAAMLSKARGVVAEPAAVALAEPATRNENRYFRPGRATKRNITGYFEPPVKKQLEWLSVDQDKTIQRLLAEALNDLFAKYGKPELCTLNDGRHERP